MDMPQVRLSAKKVPSNEDTREKHDGTGNTGFEDGTYDVMTIAACVVVAPTKGTWRSDLVAP
jgi:hypothetical protein